MSFFFSTESMDNLNTVHLLLKTVALNVLNVSKIDFGISYGRRPTPEQQKLYKKGVTQCDGIIKRSNHQVSKEDEDNPDAKANAIDFVCFIDGKPVWDLKYYYYVGALFESEARKLGIKIKWGGFFSFEDGGHLEKVT